MTLEEIAKEIGVSKSTVSRALSGKGRIGEKTRNRILEVAKRQLPSARKHPHHARVGPLWLRKDDGRL